MEEAAAVGVVGCVFDWAAVGTPCEGSLGCTGDAGGSEGECRSTSTCAASGAAEGGVSAFEASSIVEAWRVELEWSDVG